MRSFLFGLTHWRVTQISLFLTCAGPSLFTRQCCLWPTDHSMLSVSSVLPDCSLRFCLDHSLYFAVLKSYTNSFSCIFQTCIENTVTWVPPTQFIRVIYANGYVEYFWIKISFILRFSCIDWQSLHKICENTGFHWPVFLHILCRKSCSI